MLSTAKKNTWIDLKWTMTYNLGSHVNRHLLFGLARVKWSTPWTKFKGVWNQQSPCIHFRPTPQYHGLPCRSWEECPMTLPSKVSTCQTKLPTTIDIVEDPLACKIDSIGHCGLGSTTLVGYLQGLEVKTYSSRWVVCLEIWGISLVRRVRSK